MAVYVRGLFWLGTGYGHRGLLTTLCDPFPGFIQRIGVMVP